MGIVVGIFSIIVALLCSLCVDGNEESQRKIIKCPIVVDKYEEEYGGIK